MTIYICIVFQHPVLRLFVSNLKTQHEISTVNFNIKFNLFVGYGSHEKLNVLSYGLDKCAAIKFNLELTNLIKKILTSLKCRLCRMKKLEAIL